MRAVRAASALVILSLILGSAEGASAQSDGPMPESCHRQEQTGAVVGGILGALAGAAIAGRHNRSGGLAIGGLLGALGGSQVAKQLSDCGRALAARAQYAAAETGEVQTIVTPDTNQRITVQPVANVADRGAQCTTLKTVIDDGTPQGQVETRRMCKDADGHWA